MFYHVMNFILTIRVFGWKLPDTQHLQIVFSKCQKHNNFMFITRHPIK